MRPRMLFACLLVPTAMFALTACGGGQSNSEPQTVTVSASPEESGVTWKYLQSEYGDFLSKECPSSLAPSPEYNSCIGQQNSGLRQFKLDAVELPPSKDRAFLLDQIDQYAEDYNEFSDRMCQVKKTQDIVCIMKPGILDMNFGTIATIVTKQAEKQ